VHNGDITAVGIIAISVYILYIYMDHLKRLENLLPLEVLMGKSADQWRFKRIIPFGIDLYNQDKSSDTMNWILIGIKGTII
jgi:hypothetical protein